MRQELSEGGSVEKTVKSVCLHFSSSAHTSTRVGCDPCSPLKMLGKVRPTTGPGGSWPFLSVRQMNSEVRSYFATTTFFIGFLVYVFLPS